ncbi:M16 family metallopeptidase [Roseospira visakhapatnamensis]|uniref:Zinc protease n=1 Tax=Roseospira visakhapatnamensis TaxID=390880 RepID=A0A7W6WB50_9PROT|nr:pitrilysin family protein [Roseospira visakhapatnamensis]MBB4267152.1 zinc protease [Roseospira visakhapatnamensis]
MREDVTIKRSSFRPVATLLGALVLAVVALVPAARAIEVDRVITPRGLEAWLVADDTNPMVTLTFAFDGGAALDPPGKAGLAHLVSGLLDEGAGDLDSRAFQHRLADLAIEMSFDAGRDSFSGTVKTLTENLDEAVELLSLALRAPRFDADAVERMRAQILAGLRYTENDPNEIARRAWYQTLFPEHPYGRDPAGTAETIAAIDQDDLRAFARGHLVRDRLAIGVAGDVTPERLAALIDEAFGDLPETSDLPAVPDIVARADGRTVVIERPVPQSVAMFGHAGLARSDPDWYAAYVVNYILGGGGFASRLVEEVREARGLAYSVYSYLVPLDHAPVWMGGVATNNARVTESLSLIQEEWRRMADAGPTAEELADARTYLTGAWPLRFSSTGSIAAILVAMQREGLSPSYLNDRNDYIEAVTLEDARRVAARLMDPAALTTVVVGQPDGLVSSN